VWVECQGSYVGLFADEMKTGAAFSSHFHCFSFSSYLAIFIYSFLYSLCLKPNGRDYFEDVSENYKIILKKDE
jgi:hypothetical protein